MSRKSQVVALTGGTGFVGRHVLSALLDRGHRVRLLSRHATAPSPGRGEVAIVRGELFDDAALAELCRGADVVVHLVGIIEQRPDRGQTFDRVHHEGTKRVLAAARAAGVRRHVHMSALGARPADVPDRRSDYHRTKWLAEEEVRRSGLEWTIFRPSIIHGPDGAFVQLVRGFWTKLFPPFVPYFGIDAGLMDAWQAVSALLWPLGALGRGGEPPWISSATAGRLQPVWVGDVARCFADAVDRPRCVGETYPMGGPDIVTWPQLYLAVRRSLPPERVRNKKIVAIPAWYARLIAGLPGVPFNRDQVVMAQEDSICQTAKVERDFDFKLAPLEEKLAAPA